MSTVPAPTVSRSADPAPTSHAATRWPSRWRGLPGWVAPAGAGVVAVTVCVVLAVTDPEDRAGWAPRCPFRAATGLDCPGCGGTRAVAALVRGDVLLALEHNLVTVLLLPLLAWGWAAWLAAGLGWRRHRLELPTWSAWTLAATFGVFAVARNLPWAWLPWLGSGAG